MKQGTGQESHCTSLFQQWLELKLRWFQILINDLPKCLRFCTSILYADDTTLFVVGNSIQCLRAKMQKDLDSLAAWLRVNHLKLNVTKTKCLLFNKEGLSSKLDLEVQGETIDTVQSFKFLGVTVDNKMDCMSHFSVLHSKLHKSSYIIHSLSRIFPRDVMRYLYFAYYHSHLTYCMLVWYPLLSKSAQTSLVLLQKRIIRSICNVNFRTHCMPLYKTLQILTLEDQCSLDNVKFYHRVLHRTCPVPVLKLFACSQHTYRTRGASVAPLSYKSNLANKSFLCKPIMLWHKLDSNIKEIDVRKNFSNKVKLQMLSLY